MTPSTLVEICDALEDTVRQGVADDVHIYPFVNDFEHLPGIVIIPDKAEFDGAFNQGSDEWFFQILVVVDTAKGDQLAQRELQGFCDGLGPNSIRRSIYEKPSLGRPDLHARVYGLKGYGGKFQWNTGPHVGAILLVKVQYV